MTGDAISAQEALRMNIVSDIVKSDNFYEDVIKIV